MSSNPRGRRPKLTPEIHAGIVQAVSEGNYQHMAAQMFNISERTLERWLHNGRKYPDGIYGEFCRDVQQAAAKWVCDTVRELNDSGEKKFIITSMYPHLYGGGVTYAIRQLEKQIQQLQAIVKGCEDAALDKQTGAAGSPA